jgi:hypothetical protein
MTRCITTTLSAALVPLVVIAARDDVAASTGDDSGSFAPSQEQGSASIR